MILKLKKASKQMKSWVLLIVIVLSILNISFGQKVWSTFEENERKYDLTNDYYDMWKVVSNPLKYGNMSDSCVRMERNQGCGVLGRPEEHAHAKIQYKQNVFIDSVKTMTVWVMGKKGARLNIEWFDESSELIKVASSWAGDDQLLKEDGVWQLVSVDATAIADHLILGVRVAICDWENDDDYRGVYFFDEFRFYY